MSMTRGLVPMPSDSELLRLKREREERRKAGGDFVGTVISVRVPASQIALWPGSPLAAGAPRAKGPRHRRPELAIQIAFFDLIDANAYRHPALRGAYAVTNHTKGGKVEGALAKRAGLRPGQQDVCIPFAVVPYSALYIELKVPGNGPTAEQLERRDILRACGNRCEFAWSVAEAWTIVCEYLNIFSEAPPE